MKQPQLILLIAFSLLIGACGRGAGTRGTFSNRAAATPAIPAGPADEIEISELLEAPEAYEGALLQVTGQYRRAPVVVCDELTRRSPATWLLAGQTQTIAARGYENLVLPLLPRGLTMTVEGVWRNWRGPVGCGKDAPVEDVWYLLVTNIVSPSPVARVTLTPTPRDGVGQAPTPMASPQATDESEPEPVGTPVPQPSATSGVATATAVPTATRPTATPATASPTPTTDAGEEEPQATVTGAAEETPTAQGTGTATSTPTATSGADGATATPTRSVVDMGTIDYQDLRGDYMSGAEMHSWQFEVRAGDTITVNVASRLETDVRLAVLDPAGNRVVDQDESGPGEIERIEGLEAAGAGTYRLLISETDGRDTDYMVILLNDGFDNYYTFRFEGVLSYGNGRSGSLDEEMDHFWFFFGNAGERVNINVAPTDNSDLILEVFDPEGNLEEEENDSGSGGSEQLLNFQLPATGLYAVRAGEFNYQPASYTVLVSRN